ncbi:GNAT family N-acetyltransferase [Thalassotalea sp. PLHSN55]|uniref:GNAT family N-acetyltransferase n=1 Tax=Thalassotalea sp. PLHSN55 TaxID=3435888 RepID=UPI003F8616B6
MDKNNQHKNITLRQHNADDLPFMLALYATTRQAELAMTNFSEQEKNQFISQQFNAQYQHYLQHYNSEHFDIIELNGAAIGRLFVDYWTNEIRIVDITLTSQYQNQGIGSYLFEQLFTLARAKKKPITIHVEHNNPAKKLYQRLGFELKTQTNDIYLLMQWTP